MSYYIFLKMEHARMHACTQTMHCELSFTFNLFNKKCEQFFMNIICAYEGNQPTTYVVLSHGEVCLHAISHRYDMHLRVIADLINRRKECQPR